MIIGIMNVKMVFVPNAVGFYVITMMKLNPSTKRKRKRING